MLQYAASDKMVLLPLQSAMDSCRRARRLPWLSQRLRLDTRCIAFTSVYALVPFPAIELGTRLATCCEGLLSTVDNLSLIHI